jgi:hypothetical protein
MEIIQEVILPFFMLSLLLTIASILVGLLAIAIFAA